MTLPKEFFNTAEIKLIAHWAPFCTLQCNMVDNQTARPRLGQQPANAQPENQLWINLETVIEPGARIVRRAPGVRLRKVFRSRVKNDLRLINRVNQGKQAIIPLSRKSSMVLLCGVQDIL